jgi:para-aminobenzoate synthetase/4-amino-4-deoxychorismate lyase
MTGVTAETAGAEASDRPDPGRGVFDTLLVRRGAPVDLARHVERLAASVLELYGVPVDAAGLAARIVAGSGGFETARVRTTYLPGGADLQVEVTAIPEPGPAPRTLAVRRVVGGWGAHKWVDRGLLAPVAGADDVLLVDQDGDVLEAGSANVFAVVDGVVVTPPLDGRILPGTVRARVLDLYASAVERRVRLEELARATELLTTSSIRGAQPVVAVLGVGHWAPGAVSADLRERL